MYLNIINEFKLDKNNKDFWLIIKSKLNHLILVLIYIFILIVLYTTMAIIDFDKIIIFNLIENNIIKNILIILFCLSPLTIIKTVLKSIKILIFGEVYKFDFIEKAIFLNNKYLNSFDDVNYLQITEIINEQSKEYIFSIVLRDDNKIRILKTNNYEILITTVEDIADVLNVKIHKK